jgi:ubiquinone/menaquinone biosynthesis C-methylase UbiE
MKSSGVPIPLARLRSAFMRAFFSLLYNQMAWTYDLVAAVVSVGMWTGWVNSVLPYLDGPHILELGHGPGHLQATLQKQAAGHPANLRITGLDKSKQMGRLAHKRLVRQGLNPGLAQGDAQRLPFRDESFNQVVATFPSEYIIRRFGGWAELRSWRENNLQPGGT